MQLATRTDGPVTAPPLVLLDSLGSDTGMWDPVLPALGDGLRVVRIDHRGHGASVPAAPTPRVPLAELAGDVLQTLDGLGLERVDIAGVSLGGMIALWLPVPRPDRVRRIGLFCTAAVLPPAQQWDERAATARAEGTAALASRVLARWVTPEFAQREPQVVDRLRTAFERVDGESYAQCCTAIGDMDQRGDLGRVSAPTLVIGARGDQAAPLERQQELADGIPGARLEVLDDAAHIATVERPEAIAALMQEHFSVPWDEEVR